MRIFVQGCTFDWIHTFSAKRGEWGDWEDWGEIFGLTARGASILCGLVVCFSSACRLPATLILNWGDARCVVAVVHSVDD